ncbi:MAG: aminotransferase class V-fold PLP-dependent enzyme [Gemmatimonadaceae bacterium]
MNRRKLLGAVGVALAGSAVRQPLDSLMPPNAPPGPRPDDWRLHFPALRQSVNGHQLVYLDTAATSLRPLSVIDGISAFYRGDNANPGGALHTLARRAAEHYEGARHAIAQFINAADASEVVFTRGTTEGLNLVAAAWGGANLRSSDDILIGMSEHASNMVPWQMIAKRSGATVRYFGVDDMGHPHLDDMQSKLGPRTRIVAFSHVSNVLGMLNPAKEMCTRARGPGRIVVIDGAQSVPHIPVDVRDLGCDFMAFSSHKMLGPMGVGVLWGRRELLDALPPYQGGSNMAHDVEENGMELSPGALKFGAGTPNASGAIGLAEAVRFLQAIGFDALRAHEMAICERALERLGRIPRVKLIGSTNSAEKISVFAFNVQGKAPPEVLRALDERGIAIRSGDLASLPLLKRFGVTRAARASAYLYTTIAEVDRFADAVEEIAR